MGGDKGALGSRQGKPRIGDLYAEILGVLRPQRHEYLTVTAKKAIREIE